MLTIKISSKNLWQWIERTRKVASYSLETPVETRGTGENQKGETFPIGGLEDQFFLNPTVKVNLFENHTWQDYARLLLPLAGKMGQNDFMEFISRFFHWEIERNFDSGHGVYFWNGPDEKGCSKQSVLEDLSPKAWENFIEIAPMPEGKKVFFYQL